MAQENHKLNQELKELLFKYEKLREELSKKENILLSREDDLNKKHKEADERISQVRKEELLITARKSDLLSNEQRVNKKDTDLDKERDNIKKREKESNEEKEKYETLKKELDEDKEDTKIKREEADEKNKRAREWEKETEAIHERAKTIDDEIKRKEEEFERKREEIENTLNEKIAEYDRRIEDLEKAKETIDDINFDSKPEGEQAKIVVKEAIRRAMKMTEDIQKEFQELDEKYNKGTFKGFATPITEIDERFEELKSQFESIKEHAVANDLTTTVAEWITFIEECIVKADENKSKWEFSESYRNILFGLASCKNYEQLLQILNDWATGETEPEEEDNEKFIDYYEILEVDENATEEEIKKAYRDLAKKYHPDKQQNETEEEKAEAAEIMKQINEAKEVLLNTEERKKFDKKRREFKEKQN